MLSTQTNTKTLWEEQLKQQNFTWAIFQFILQAKEHAFLPGYKGSMIRGGFGHSFRKVCCTVQNQECSSCILNKSCPYAYVFETPKLNGMALDHQADNLPHPFVIEPDCSEQTEFQASDELVFQLILIGKSIDFLPYFIYTFDQMGKIGLGRNRHRFELTAVYAFDDLPGQSQTLIYDHQSQILTGNYKVWELNELFSLNPESNFSKIKIKFVTPTRILQTNKLVSRVPFELFIRNLLRRISLLGKIHCESSWDLPYGEIIEQATNSVHLLDNQLTWHSMERYSNRQGKKMNIGGFEGTVIYEGQFRSFLPLIILGQFTHVGKNTTFGLGKYVLTY